jgi:hypothetical protein
MTSHMTFPNCQSALTHDNLSVRTAPCTRTRAHILSTSLTGSFRLANRHRHPCAASAPAADAIELSAEQIERLGNLAPATGERHEEGNTAVIDR